MSKCESHSFRLFWHILRLSAVVALVWAPSMLPASDFQYTRTVWRAVDGLPEATVQALAEAPDGALWIGTTGGLATFDGADIRAFSPAAMQALGTQSVFCITGDRDGSLWAGTEGGGLLHLTSHGVTRFSMKEGLADAFVRTVFVDRSGTLWAGTDNGLFRMRSGRLQRVDDGVAVPRLAVHAIAQDSHGNLWVGGSKLLEISPEHAVREYALLGAYSNNRVKTILQTSDGSIWVGTVGGLQRMTNEHFERIPSIRATVRALLQARDGTLWIGTIGKGLWRFQNGRAVPLQIPGLLPSATVLRLLQDSDGQIWIGTQAGMVRLSRTDVSILPLPQGGDPDFETISGDAQGEIWVAAQQLYTIHNGSARKLEFPGLPHLSVRNVFRGRDGALWLGTDGSGAYRLEGNSKLHLASPRDLTNNFIRAFLQSHDGAMWIATDEGVSRIAGKDIRKFTEASGLSYFSTRCLFEDKEGGVWIGTDMGISLWKGGSFQHNDVTSALAAEKVWSILQDRSGILWFATRDHGLFRWHNGVLDHLTTAQGLPSNSIYAVLQDQRGTFWLTGPDTIVSVSESDMDRPTLSSEMPLSVEVYTMPFGADGAQLYGGRQPAGFVAPDGTVWFPTSRGAAYIRPARDQPFSRGPHAVITSVAEDGRNVPLRSGLRVPAGVTRLSFGLESVFLRPQAGLRFRYRLDPLDSAWGSGGAEHTATYTNLAAGRYRLRLQAFDAAHPELVSEAEFSFVKSQYLYQTWWFYALAVIALLAAVWAIYRVRVAQMHRQFQAVLTERNRLAREMHDTVIQGCTGISALLEAIASVDAHNADNQLLRYAREQTRTTIDEARHAVWDMRHEEGEVDVLEAIRALAAQTRREHGSDVTIREMSPALPIGSSAAHEILMTVREAVYNAVQHSGSTRIELSAEELDGELTVRVTDFGRGFDPNGRGDVQDGHFGIVGMRERMKRLGGRLEMHSASGSGTTVTLRVRHSRRRYIRERAPFRT